MTGPGAAELLRVADMVLVADVLARLTHAADSGTLEEYGELLTEDAVWEMPENGSTRLPAQVRRGRADLLAGAAQRRAAGLQGPGTASRHVIGNVSVVPDGDTARSTAYWRFYTGTTGTPRLVAAGTYRDLHRREGAVWRLAHRRIGVG
ncbi:nuclear transport factor 2 family protein [Blastococcus sp. SYSU D00820]